MRREGYEFAVSKAEVLYHTDENGKKTEPMEMAYVDVPDEFTGVVIEKLSQRKVSCRTWEASAAVIPVLNSRSVPWSHRLSWRLYDRYKR